MEQGRQSDMILGIDVGSVSVSLVCLNRNGKVIEQRYAMHYGNARDTLAGMLESYDPASIAGIAAPAGKTRFREHIGVFDTQVSLMEAVAGLGIHARSILHVGAERC